MDIIDPKDLAMYQAARRNAGLAERELLKAQQAHQQAQRQHDGAIGALQFVTQAVLERHGLPPGATFHVETGAIALPDQQQAEPGQTAE